MTVFQKLFTWWNGATIGTALFTARKGERVGEDQDGNIYYKARQGDRRWVIYKGEVEASRVPPEWHRWLHRTTNDLPDQSHYVPKPWEKPHRPNLTGSDAAYAPPGSLKKTTGRDRATGDYEPWRPN
ncbi:NADH dehydrogenase [Iodidimonas nitroreducens]|uniref:NADH dehydrogenase n=1 Tax=Iodidimonas nitroreducens TaxID=1236968 RepID=A0A5A7N4R7_9PROT|nr:NADH:ubiquinone oxidoreductase subunit NDUFA12 [Iodidimonas nitroreducens]GAK32948.1 NADH dehydrogenase [ubiquinone] 1 alpha subcomplex subunit 12 [alpha proteobacterium Q-1]GER03118.1 NADH dehydrogenase [Iodidimonas nitroreducens]